MTGTLTTLKQSLRQAQGKRLGRLGRGSNLPHPLTDGFPLPPHFRGQTPPERAFLGRKLHVTGLIEEYEGKPQIVVTDPGQIYIRSQAQAPLEGER